jgi:AcrR family transcriptional regulator
MMNRVPRKQASVDSVAPTGAAKTRLAIADAARELFATHEYADASVRTIAARAGADPALVIRYFKSKENLFLETVAFEGFFEPAMAGPLDGLGVRLVDALLSDEHDAGFTAYRALLRASGSELVRERLQQAIHHMFVEPLAPRLSGDDVELRARLVAAQIGGLIDAIAILGDTVIGGAERAHLATVYGAALQSLITDAPG